MNRSWREAPATRKGNPWIATHPVLNADDYLFAFSNVRDENNVVLLSDLKAVIPKKLGKAVATDTVTTVIPWRNNAWTENKPAKTSTGIKGFRAANKKAGTRNQQMNDPAWRAKPDSAISVWF